MTGYTGSRHVVSGERMMEVRRNGIFTTVEESYMEYVDKKIRDVKLK